MGLQLTDHGSICSLRRLIAPVDTMGCEAGGADADDVVPATEKVSGDRPVLRAKESSGN